MKHFQSFIENIVSLEDRTIRIIRLGKKWNGFNGFLRQKLGSAMCS
jgi:hypothetical protein